MFESKVFVEFTVNSMDQDVIEDLIKTATDKAAAWCKKEKIKDIINISTAIAHNHVLGGESRLALTVFYRRDR